MMLLNKIKFLLLLLPFISFVADAMGDDIEELFPDLKEVTYLVEESIIELGQKRSPDSNEELPPPKKSKNDEAYGDVAPKIESLNYESIFADLHTIMYKEKTFSKYVENLSSNSLMDWMYVSAALYLMKINVSSDEIIGFFHQIPRPKKRVGFTEASLKKIMNSFDQLAPKNNPYRFSSTFSQVMREYFIPRMREYLSIEEMKDITSKLDYLEENKRDKDIVVSTNCIADPSLKTKLLQAIEEEYEPIKRWILQEIKDEATQVALLSFVARKDLFEKFLQRPPTLKNCQYSAALSVFFRKLGVHQNTVFLFFHEARKNEEIIFQCGTAESIYKKFIDLKNLKDIDNILLKNNTAKDIDRVLAGQFAETILDDLEPLFKIVTNNPQAKFENRNILLKFRKRFTKEVEDERSYVAISDEQLLFLQSKLPKDNDLVNYIASLPLNDIQKAGLFSVALNDKIIKTLKILNPYFQAQPLVIGLCVYLRHFGVPSSVILELLLKTRNDPIYNFGVKTAGTLFNNFRKRDFEDDASKEIFRASFFETMIGVFLPLLRETTADEGAEFLRTENELALYNTKKTTLRDAPHTFFVAHGVKHADYEEKARALNPSLVNTLQKEFSTPSHQAAFYALLTIKIGEIPYEAYVKNISSNKFGKDTVIKSTVIFLSHFGVNSTDIYNFILKVRGEEFISTHSFSLQQVYDIIDRYFGEEKNDTWLNSFSKTLKGWVPILRDVTHTPKASFLSAL